MNHRSRAARPWVRCLFAAVLFFGCRAARGDPVAPGAAGPCPVQPTGSNFQGQNLTNANFRAYAPGSLAGANFKGAILKGAIFAGQDLTGASFENADLGPSEKGPADLTGTTLTNTCFINATMNATNLTFATITCADFSNTSLMEAFFGPLQKIVKGNGCRTKFVGARLDVNAITTDHWGKIVFTDADFQNLSPSTFNLRQKDITGAILVRANFTGIDMTGANLTGVDFTQARLTNAKLDNAAANGITLRNARLDSASLRCARFYGTPGDDAGTPRFDNCKSTPVSAAPTTRADLTQANLQNANLQYATLKYAGLRGSNLSSVQARSSTFASAFLEPQPPVNSAQVLGSDFSYADFSNAHVNYVRFNNTIMTGAIFESNTTLAGTDFSGSIMPLARFSTSMLQNVSFNNTILQGAQFAGAKMQTTPDGAGSGVSFTCAQLGGVNFKDAVITAASFEAAVLPPASACCPQPGGVWCGTIDATQTAYGAVTYPVLQANINCPNGDVAPCSGNQWILPNWRTSECSPDHHIATVWTKPDCGSTPSDVVKFSDPNLKACVLASLPGSPTDVTRQTAAQLPTISCPGKQIATLGGLEDFTGLVSLDLTANRIAQFAFNLPRLRTLKLPDNQLSSLDIGRNPALVLLDVSNNELKSIAGTVNSYLQVFEAQNNQLTSFDLAVQSSLRYADLSANRLTSVLDQFNGDLSQLTNLTYLDLSNNSLQTIGSIRQIAAGDSNLDSLFLQCNPAFDCRSLAVDGKSEAMQTSHCAEFNPASNQWIVLAKPSCPASH